MSDINTYLANRLTPAAILALLADPTFVAGIESLDPSPTIASVLAQGNNAQQHSITNLATVTANSFIGNGSQLTGLPTFAQLLAQNSDAGGHSITNVGTLSAENFAGNGSQLTNIPIPGLSSILAASNDGGGQTISNVSINATNLLANSIGLEGGGPINLFSGPITVGSGLPATVQTDNDGGINFTDYAGNTMQWNAWDWYGLHLQGSNANLVADGAVYAANFATCLAPDGSATFANGNISLGANGSIGGSDIYGTSLNLESGGPINLFNGLIIIGTGLPATVQTDYDGGISFTDYAGNTMQWNAWDDNGLQLSGPNANLYAQGSIYAGYGAGILGNDGSASFANGYASIDTSGAISAIRVSAADIEIANINVVGSGNLSFRGATLTMTGSGSGYPATLNMSDGEIVNAGNVTAASLNVSGGASISGNVKVGNLQAENSEWMLLNQAGYAVIRVEGTGVPIFDYGCTSHSLSVAGNNSYIAYSSDNNNYLGNTTYFSGVGSGAWINGSGGSAMFAGSVTAASLNVSGGATVDGVLLAGSAANASDLPGRGQFQIGNDFVAGNLPLWSVRVGSSDQSSLNFDGNYGNVDSYHTRMTIRRDTGQVQIPASLSVANGGTTLNSDGSATFSGPITTIGGISLNTTNHPSIFNTSAFLYDAGTHGAGWSAAYLSSGGGPSDLVRWDGGTSSASGVLKNNGHLLLGTTTDNGTDKLQVNGSATFAGPITPGSINTATTPGTAAGQIVYDASGGANSGHAWLWNGSVWKQLDN